MYICARCGIEPCSACKASEQRDREAAYQRDVRERARAKDNEEWAELIRLHADRLAKELEGET